MPVRAGAALRHAAMRRQLKRERKKKKTRGMADPLSLNKLRPGRIPENRKGSKSKPGNATQCVGAVCLMADPQSTREDDSADFHATLFSSPRAQGCPNVCVHADIPECTHALKISALTNTNQGILAALNRYRVYFQNRYHSQTHFHPGRGKAWKAQIMERH